jgi:hypothetical protein
MVTGYSRWLSAVLDPSRAAEDLFAGWWQLIGALGAVPRLLVWDGEGAVGQYRRGDSRRLAAPSATQRKRIRPRTLLQVGSGRRLSHQKAVLPSQPSTTALSP